jgi:hypothetical protein
MTPGGTDKADVLSLVGQPFDRGRAQSSEGTQTWQEVRQVTRDRIDAARDAGLLGDAARAYLARQQAFARSECPTAMAELAGIAEAFDLSENELFQHLHLGTLRDLAQVGAGPHDGCSAWAVSDGPDGPLAVKNRDFSGGHAGIQRVFHHDGPDLKHGPMLCLGSLGSPGAYSSGMNAAGLAVVDTQVGVRAHAVGWLRYFLMTRLLAESGDVAAAVAMIRGLGHAGGGTLVLADASGDVAAVELGAAGVSVETAPVVCRTNHFTTTALAPQTFVDRRSFIDDSSAARRAFLDRVLPGRDWSADNAARLMGRHRDGDAPDVAPLCQHGGVSGTRTLSSVVYCCRSRLMYVCPDNPCSGAWQSIALTP